MSTTTAPSPPELKHLRLEIDGEIGTLTLDRPKVAERDEPRADRRAGHGGGAGWPTAPRCAP